MKKAIRSTVNTILVLFTALFSLVSHAGSTAKNEQPTVPQITAEELLSNRDKYVVLDVRTIGEFAIGHIEDAINISHRDIDDQLDKIKAIKKPIVIHCRSGKRAADAEATLLLNGVTNILHLKGDMIGWKEKDLPLVRGTAQPDLL